MKLEVGETYLNLLGQRVEIVADDGNSTYPFDGDNGNCYTRCGKIWINRESVGDLISLAYDVPEVAIEQSANKYKRTVPTTEIDIYDVIVAWDIRCPARQHALKKIMCAGERGAKGVVQDLDEAIQALQRAKELVG